MVNSFFVFRNKNFCYFCRFYQERAFDFLFDWLANLISSSISIGSLNKHQLAEMLLTAAN